VAASRFKMQVRRASEVVNHLSSSDLGRAQALRTQLQQALSRQAGEIEQVRAAVDVKAQLSIEEAIRASQPGLEADFVGVVEAIAPETWIIGGRTVLIDIFTEIKGDIVVGNLVKVHALVDADGALTAREIELYDDDSEFNFSGIVESISPTGWVISQQAVAVTAETKIEAGIAAGDLVKVKTLVASDGTLTAREIEKLDKQGEDNFHFSGIVEAIMTEGWLIGGQLVQVTEMTEIEDGIEVGSAVRVEGIVAPDGSIIAREIKLFDGQEQNGNTNANGNENENENANGNENQNENANGNENENENANGNENENDNANGNENQNGNDNGQQDNDDSNDNDSGGNDNGNDSGSSEDSGGGDQNSNDNDND
jgi:hypothetical protein